MPIVQATERRRQTGSVASFARTAMDAISAASGSTERDNYRTFSGFFSMPYSSIRRKIEGLNLGAHCLRGGTLAKRHGRAEAKILEQVHDSLWVAEGEILSFFGLAYPTRSVIAKLMNGDLWIWSPVKLTAILRSEVDRLGLVRHLVSPNKLHHLYLQEWKVAYPQALLWGPESTIRKRPDLKFREALQNSPPPEWQADIDQAWFRGSFAMDEIVFLHRPSATAIVADLVQTFSDHFLREHWGRWRFLARLDGLTEDQAYAPLEWRLSFINRAPARQARDKVLSWTCQRVIVAHGEWPRDDGNAFLAKSFRWLGH